MDSENKERRTKGKPLTFGPSGEGKYLAIAICAGCGAEVMGGYQKKNKIPEGLDPVAIVQLHRDKAIRKAMKKFKKHTCREKPNAVE
jgi:hypothetical protein